MTSHILPDPGERNPTLTDDQLRLYLRPECCVSFALQAVVRELLERRKMDKLSLWEKVCVELDAAAAAIGGDQTSAEYLAHNEFGLAYEVLLRFNVQNDKFQIHMEKAAQLMGLEIA